MPSTLTPQFRSDLLRLIEANRDRALWHLAPHYVPQTHAEVQHVLKLIASRGDRATWVVARELLSQLS